MPPAHAHEPAYPLAIALIGLSGTGKSTVARVLAAQTGRVAVDTDARIVEQIGQPIADFFASAGEQAFRDLETATLREVLQIGRAQSQVIATGGGLVLRKENRSLLRDYAYVVWLDAPTPALLARLRRDDEQRPLLAGDDPATRIEALRTARAHIYRDLAHQTIDTSSLPPAEVAARILEGYAAHQTTVE